MQVNTAVVRRAASVTAAAFVALAFSLASTPSADAGVVPEPAPLFGSVVQGGIDVPSCTSLAGSYNFVTNANCFFSLAPLATAGFVADTGSSAFAQAQFSLGAVSVATSSSSGTHSGASTLIWDTLTFSGAAPGAEATVTMSGASSLAGDGRTSAVVWLGAPPATDSPYFFLVGNYSNFICNNGVGPNGVDPCTSSYSVQSTWQLSTTSQCYSRSA